MWFPDRIQWVTIWVAFLLASLMVADDAAGPAVFIVILALLIIWYREGRRRQVNAVSDLNPLATLPVSVKELMSTTKKLLISVPLALLSAVALRVILTEMGLVGGPILFIGLPAIVIFSFLMWWLGKL
ncbi:MAG: hypothetical protein WCC18_18575 [Candidatus Acidiferrales bacterium]